MALNAIYINNNSGYDQSCFISSAFIAFGASLLGPKCNNGFVAFKINGLLQLGPNFIISRTLITFETNLVLHLGPLLYSGPNPYYIVRTFTITFRTFIEFILFIGQNVYFYLRPLLHLGPNPYYI